MGAMPEHREHLDGLRDYIEHSPTSFHAVAAAAARLLASGFTELDEGTPWSAVEGAHFVRRDGALIAWRTPQRITARTGLRIVGAHTDSPSFVLKPKASYDSAGWAMANVEVYGGPIMASWLDRELGLAGRLVDRQGEQHLVRTGALLRIPHLAIHLDRSINEKLTLDPQANLVPLYGLSGQAPEIEDLLCGLAGIAREDLVHHDLRLFPVQPGQTFGAEQEFFASWRLDNLSSVHAALQALLDLDQQGEDVVLLAAFDHEEVGSGTRSGASGPLLSDLVTRIGQGLGFVGDAYLAMLARSSCVSADAGHAVHPNYPGRHDVTNHPQVNGGPLLKINANQRYATDAPGAAIWARACRAAGVSTQPFVSNNAVPCGTTIGPLTATRLGIRTVDVGIALLSMHSARELCGSRDPYDLSRAMGAYWAGA